MTALAANSLQLDPAPEFLILSALQPDSAAWAQAAAQLDDVRVLCARVLGFEPKLRLAPGGKLRIQPRGETFVIPAAFDFSLWERESMGQQIAGQRRDYPDSVIYHDDVDSGHPLVIDALGQQVVKALGRISPQKCGLILAASGDGDSGSRAHSYRLMRLLWEQIGFAGAEVAFVRNAKPFLGHVLEQCAAANMPFMVVFQGQWQTEHADYARLIFENFQRSHDEAASWIFAPAPQAHPSLNAWYAQRITRLWQEKRTRESLQATSLNKSPRSSAQPVTAAQRYGGGLIARISDGDSLTAVLRRVLPERTPDRVIVKVTWHGYAAGTYTDPAALDLLLGALPAPAVVVEGHTVSRNLGGQSFDWATEARENRAWIRQQESEYLRRTGISEVLTRHGAEYVNVTEAYWDEDSPGDPAQFIPQALLDLRGCPMLSYAKFKGPTRLAISNMFGLIPLPLRSEWHGPNITWFARACCDLTKSYGSVFEMCGIVEGLYTAVRWNRKGLYRSRWGNYDLIRDAGYITASRGLVAADILASRVQAQDVYRSAFFDVVRAELGWDSEAADEPLPESTLRVFA
jgi:hypothetical protein